MSPAKTQPKISGEQQDIFHQLGNHLPPIVDPNAPDLDLRDSLRLTCKEMMRQARNRYGLSRDMLTDRINLCLPESSQITKRQLDSWSACSKEDHPLPAHILPALIWACRANISPLQLLADSLGMHLVDETEHLATQLGQTVTEKARLAKAERELKQQLGVLG